MATISYLELELLLPRVVLDDDKDILALAELDRVAYQLGHDLLDALSITHHTGWNVGAPLYLQINTNLLGSDSEYLIDLREDISYVECLLLLGQALILQ